MLASSPTLPSSSLWYFPAYWSALLAISPKYTPEPYMHPTFPTRSSMPSCLIASSGEKASSENCTFPSLSRAPFPGHPWNSSTSFFLEVSRFNLFTNFRTLPLSRIFACPSLTTSRAASEFFFHSPSMQPIVSEILRIAALLLQYEVQSGPFSILVTFVTLSPLCVAHFPSFPLPIFRGSVVLSNKAWMVSFSSAVTSTSS
mmetsp:Transcript_29879/g.79515  ORF Transcript_29879/g.79515 Transcript_29879/m.79515 type:complete len:201 (-) Transcript_29879:482-1084(-)